MITLSVDVRTAMRPCSMRLVSTTSAGPLQPDWSLLADSLKYSTLSPTFISSCSPATRVCESRALFKRARAVYSTIVCTATSRKRCVWRAICGASIKASSASVVGGGRM
eukprot:6037971-Amphidinium_carterae.1